MHNWIQTYTCQAFDPCSANLKDILIEDIAHALSLTCRYLGHCKWLYSVAQHCVLGTEWLQNNKYDGHYQLAFLLHDASEAYLSDIPRPLKQSHLFSNYKIIEERLQQQIFNRFRIYFSPDNPMLHWVDQQVCHSEAPQVLTKIHPNSNLFGRYDVLKVKVERWSPEETEHRFLEHFFRLYPRH